jgi:hypothetical protein
MSVNRLGCEGQSMKKSKRNERGVALLLAMVALLLLSGIGLAMMYSADTETTINTNYRDLQVALNASYAGVEEGRDRLRVGVSGAVVPPTSLPISSAQNVLYILNPANNTDPVAPWDTSNTYFDTEFCHENFLGLSGTVNAPCTTIASGSGWYRTKNNLTDSPASVYKLASPLSYKWIRINAKANNSTSFATGTGASGTQVCWNGSAQVAASPCTGSLAPVLLITSLAVTQGGARRMMQSEITQNAPPGLPAAVVLDGAGPTFGTPHSANFSISGVNQNSCGQSPAPPSIPAIGVVNSADDNYVTGELFRPDLYPGINPAPDVQVTTTSQLGVYGTIPGLVSMVSSVTSVADYVGPSPPTLGTVSSPQVTVITGNYSPSDCTGAGVLIVTGNLVCGGGWDWHGTVFVLGGFFQTNGGGNGALIGAMLVAKAYDATHTPPVPYTGVSAAVPNYPLPGAPTWDYNGGGINHVTYDSCWTSLLNSKLPYRVLSTRELNY